MLAVRISSSRLLGMIEREPRVRFRATGIFSHGEDVREPPMHLNRFSGSRPVIQGSILDNLQRISELYKD